MIPEQFSFSRNKFHVAITAMSLGLLVLLSASLGFGGGGAIIKESFGQFNTAPSDGGVEDGGVGGNEQESTTLPTNVSTFLLRGLIGSSLPAAGGNTSAENNNSNTGHIAVGRFRIFANESLVNRFITEIDLAAIDGTAVHNVTIEETVPHRFELTQSSNTANITTANGSTPSISSNLMTRIYVDSNIPVIDNVSMTISIRGQVLTVEGINIDETTIADIGQRDILSIIDGQRIFGIVSG
ncbi:MAG: hypothetical protein ACJ71D_05410 [Nitrososphaera sp.]